MANYKGELKLSGTGSAQKLGHMPRDMTDDEESALADDLVEWMQLEGNVFFKDFLLSKGLDDSWLKRAIDRNPHVKKQHRLCKEIQEAKIVKGALLDEGFNASFAKFILINRYRDNWAEKTEVKHSGDAQNPVLAILQTAKEAPQGLVGSKPLD